MKIRTTFLVTSALAASVACGSTKVNGFTLEPDAGSSGGLGGGTDNTLVVDPINAILFLDTATKPVTHATQAYTVTRRLAAATRTSLRTPHSPSISRRSAHSPARASSPATACRRARAG